MLLFEERLSVDKHFRVIGDFYCGADSPLDVFLKNDAFEYEDNRYGNTYVILSNDDQSIVWGFYTLKVNGIQVEEQGEYIAMPVIEIARIAINHEVQNSGVGKYVFYNYILPKVIEVSKIVAVKAIIAFVESEDCKAVGFYKGLGFEKTTDLVQKEIEESFNEHCDLYLVSLDDICM